MFSSLRVADYRRLYFGNMAFQFNSWAQQLTFGWLLLLIGNSPFWLGLNGAMTGIALTVMAPIGGAIADSWERRRCLLRDAVHRRQRQRRHRGAVLARLPRSLAPAGRRRS